MDQTYLASDQDSQNTTTAMENIESSPSSSFAPSSTTVEMQAPSYPLDNKAESNDMADIEMHPVPVEESPYHATNDNVDTASDNLEETELGKKIFGDESGEEEPKFGGPNVLKKRAQQRRPTKQAKPISTPQPSSEAIPDKILEARKDFDEAMEKIKSLSGRRKHHHSTDSEPVDLDEIALEFCRKMLRASEFDAESIDAGTPALEKQKLLSEVQAMLNKKHLHEVLLDNGVLEPIRKWLEPLPNRQLPAPNIRKVLLESLKGLPIETVHLRESGIGKIIMFFSQRKNEIPEIRRLAESLVISWSRPILARNVNSSFSQAERSERARDGSLNNSPRHGLVLRSETLKQGAMGSVSMPYRKLAAHLQKKNRPNTTIR